MPQEPFTSELSDDVFSPQVLIAVQSAPQNKYVLMYSTLRKAYETNFFTSIHFRELRDEIRSTWGNACVTTHRSWCYLIFILGQIANPSDNLQEDIEDESNQYGDILQESFLDSYNNLTIKSIHILKYFVKMTNGVGNKYLLKTDDDSFIHLETLWDLAKFRLNTRSNHLVGYLQLGVKKHHYLPLAHKPTAKNLKIEKWIRWLIPSYMYNKKFFPQFLSGSGYFIPSNSAKCLLEHSKVFIYQLQNLLGLRYTSK